MGFLARCGLGCRYSLYKFPLMRTFRDYLRLFQYFTAIIANMVKFQENVAACVNSAAQYGAIAALEGPKDALREMLAQYTVRRQVVLEEFSTVPGLKCLVPQGAFYALVDISETGMEAEAFAMDLLQKTRVIVVPGHAFGDMGKRYVRLSFAVSEERIRKGIGRIRAYMEDR